MTQDSHDEKRRKHMAVMDDKTRDKTMTAPKLTRYWAMQGPIKQADDGEYVRYDDAQAALLIERQERLQVTAADGATHRFYTEAELQAAVAAAIRATMQPIIAEHLIYDSIAKGGHGSDELAKIADAIGEKWAAAILAMKGGE